LAVKNPRAFYDRVRQRDLLGPVLTPAEVEGCEAIIQAAFAAGWSDADLAYGLATAWHETAHTMQPIKEYGGPEYLRRNYDVTGRNPDRARAMGNTAPGDGVRYAGRGFVQLTWKRNYKIAGDKLGIDLVREPDKAMVPIVAAGIMAWGMKEGWFTGRKLADYLPRKGPASVTAFTNARKIINGNDKAAHIASLAIDFQEAIAAGNA
jgi:putative chitinase